jgi:hypothetical protein
MATVHISEEEARGCGYRKPAKGGVGIYLVGPNEGTPCGRLPYPLHACPVCSEGIKPSRSWTWIEPSKLIKADSCEVRCPCRVCPLCLAVPEGRHGLLWIGEGFYKDPEDFMREARRMGVSRKLPAVPKGFKLGETIVYLAHRYAAPVHAGEEDASKGNPGIFTVFKPTGIDLVIADENDVPERATKLAEQIGEGARIVKVVRKGEQTDLFGQPTGPDDDTDTEEADAATAQ